MHLLALAPLIHGARPSLPPDCELLHSAASVAASLAANEVDKIAQQPSLTVRQKRRHRRSNSFDPASLSRSISNLDIHTEAVITSSEKLTTKKFTIVNTLLENFVRQIHDWLQCDWEQQSLPDGHQQPDQVHTPTDSFLSCPTLRLDAANQRRGRARSAFRGLLSPLLILLCLGIGRCLLESRLRHGPLTGNPLSCLATGGGPLCLASLAVLAFVALNMAVLLANCGGHRRLGVVSAACLLLVSPACVVLWSRPSPVLSFAAMSASVWLFLKLATFHLVAFKTVTSGRQSEAGPVTTRRLCYFVLSSRLATSETGAFRADWNTLSYSLQLTGLLAASVSLSQQWLLPSLEAAAASAGDTAASNDEQSATTPHFWLLVTLERQLRLSAPVIAVCLLVGLAGNRFFKLIDHCCQTKDLKSSTISAQQTDEQWWNASSLSDLFHQSSLALSASSPIRQLKLPGLAWALLTQLVVSVSLRSPRLWPLLIVTAVLPALNLVSKKLGNNVFVWLCMVLGLPVLSQLAHTDYYQYYLVW